MRKQAIIAALSQFSDDDELVIGEMACSYVPRITAVCGGRQKYMPYFCIRPKGHPGKCYCSSKAVSYVPEVE